MSTLVEVERAALSLEERQRAQLAESLLNSLTPGDDWTKAAEIEEAERRGREIEAGQALVNSTGVGRASRDVVPSDRQPTQAGAVFVNHEQSACFQRRNRGSQQSADPSLLRSVQFAAEAQQDGTRRARLGVKKQLGEIKILG